MCICTYVYTCTYKYTYIYMYVGVGVNVGVGVYNRIRNYTGRKPHILLGLVRKKIGHLIGCRHPSIPCTSRLQHIYIQHV